MIRSILVLTGAGISAESGIPTFRGGEGLWEGHRLEDVATPEAFERDPHLVQDFYNQRRRNLLDPSIEPNAAHFALATLEREFPGEFLLVTQNIDDLHQRAGSTNVLPMHGELLKARCVESGELFEWRDDLTMETPHPKSAGGQRPGRLRPHVVWFGEMPLGMNAIEQAAQEADIFIAIGTSAVVYPAAGIVGLTKPNCEKYEVNLADTPTSTTFDHARRGPASVEVPQLVAELLERTKLGQG